MKGRSPAWSEDGEKGDTEREKPEKKFPEGHWMQSSREELGLEFGRATREHVHGYDQKEPDARRLQIPWEASAQKIQLLWGIRPERARRITQRRVNLRSGGFLYVRPLLLFLRTSDGPMAFLRNSDIVVLSLFRALEFARETN